MLTLGEESLLHGAIKEAHELEIILDKEDENDNRASIIRRLVDLVRHKDREIHELELKISSMKRRASRGLPLF